MAMNELIQTLDHIRILTVVPTGADEEFEPGVIITYSAKHELWKMVVKKVEEWTDFLDNEFTACTGNGIRLGNNLDHYKKYYQIVVNTRRRTDTEWRPRLSWDEAHEGSCYDSDPEWVPHLNEAQKELTHSMKLFDVALKRAEKHVTWLEAKAARAAVRRHERRKACSYSYDSDDLSVSSGTSVESGPVKKKSKKTLKRKKSQSAPLAVITETKKVSTDDDSRSPKRAATKATGGDE